MLLGFFSFSTVTAGCEMSRYDSVLDWTLSESDSEKASLADGRRRSRSEVRWTPRRPGSRWRSVSRLNGRPEKERLARIERENQILLQKILDCHLGYDRRRTSHIPRASRTQQIRNGTAKLSSHFISNLLSLFPTDDATANKAPAPSSNQINAKQIKQKTDYENLLLLKKILSAKPSKYVRDCTRGLAENIN